MGFSLPVAAFLIILVHNITAINYELEAHFIFNNAAPKEQHELEKEFKTSTQQSVHIEGIKRENDKVVLVNGVVTSDLDEKKLLETLSKPQSGDFHVRVYYIRKIANKEDRVRPWVATPEPLVSEKAACHNGGFKENGTCTCSKYWMGSKCQTPDCRRFGIVHRGACVCVEGWQSPHCHMRSCLPPADDMKFEKNTVHLVVSLLKSMSHDIEVLKKSIGGLLKDVDERIPDYIDGYVLTTYLDTKDSSYIQTLAFTDRKDLIERVQGLQSADGKEKQPMLQAIWNNIQTYPWEKTRSTMLVFGDTSDRDATQISHVQVNPALQSQLMQALTVRRVKPVFVTTGPVDKQTTTVLKWLAKCTLGDLHEIEKTNLEKLWTRLPDYYMRESLDLAYYYPCNINKDVKVKVDHDREEYNLQTTGDVHVFSGEKEMKPTFVVDDHIKYYTLRSPNVTIKGGKHPNLCSYRAYIRSRRSTVFSYTDLYNMDQGHILAVERFKVISVWRFPFMEKPESVKFTAMDAAGTRILNEATGWFVKGDCNFPYQIDHADWICELGPFLSIVDIKYKNGTVIHRVMNGYCTDPVHTLTSEYLCVEKGGKMKDGKCECFPGHYGPSCEHDICEIGEKVFTYAETPRKYKSLTFVVEESMMDILPTISKLAEKLAKSEFAHQIMLYNLIIARQEPDVIISHRALDRFRDAVKKVQPQSTTRGDVDLQGALKKAVRFSWAPSADPPGLMFIVAKDATLKKNQEFLSHYDTKQTEKRLISSIKPEDLTTALDEFMKHKDVDILFGFSYDNNGHYIKEDPPFTSGAKFYVTSQIHGILGYNKGAHIDSLEVEQFSGSKKVESSKHAMKDSLKPTRCNSHQISDALKLAPGADKLMLTAKGVTGSGKEFVFNKEVLGTVLESPACLNGTLKKGFCHCDRSWEACLNGTLKEGFCDCDRMWEGTRCELPLCVNACLNGTLKEGFCHCDRMWEGTRCELPLCVNGGTRVGTICNCGRNFGEHCHHLTHTPAQLKALPQRYVEEESEAGTIQPSTSIK